MIIQLTDEQMGYLKSLLDLINHTDVGDIRPVQDEIDVIKEVYKDGYIDTDTKLEEWVYDDIGDMINSWKYWYVKHSRLIQK